MRRFLAGGLVGVALLAWTGAPRAVTVTGLYDADVPVASQDAAERDRALRGALLEVVVRVSGQRRVPPTGVLSGALQNPSRFVQEFGYGSAPDAGAAAPRPSAGGSGRLWVRFDPGAVNQLLKQAGLPVWGRSRPTTVLWLAVERDGQRDLVGATDPGALSAAVQSRARARGVPILLPTLDGEDRGRVRVDDVWGELTDKVSAASRRYQADVVVLAHARERIPELWESRWTVVAGGAPEHYAVDGDRLDKVVAEGVDRVADRVAARFAQAAAPEPTPAATAEGPLPDLVVIGVDSFDAYLRARRQIEGSNGVSSVQTVRLDPGRATFRLRAQGDRESISRALAVGRALVPVDGGSDWTFQLMP